MDENIRHPFIGISRHRIFGDGDGVTTLALFHGCPLDCRYCLNPRSKKGINDCGPLIWHTPESLVEALMKDNLYFKATGGGICFGGGEPLTHAHFIQSFRNNCPPEWKISVETSLNVPYEQLEIACSCIDEWIIDIKDINHRIYKAYTGKNNAIVLDNLKWLASQGISDSITVRIPLIPNYNNEDCRKSSASYVNDLGIHRIDLSNYMLPDERDTYHKARGKSSRKPYGKDTCTILKSIRQLIAKKNNIGFTPHTCTYEGPCMGTCPVCEQEVKFIEMKLHEMSLRGNIVTI